MSAARRMPMTWPMKATLAGIVALVAAIAPASALAQPPDPRLQGVESFAFAIGNHTLDGNVAERYRDYDLVAFDGQEARRADIRAVQAHGGVVLGYLSVGTIESYRPWYRLLKRYRLEAWKDWNDEFYADVSRRGYRRAIIRKVAPPLLAKGFDGLFLDNTDMIEARRYRSETKGMRILIRGLSRLTGSDGGLLFAQNGASVIGPSLPYLDGWNREDVSFTYDFDRRRYEAVRRGDHVAALRELERIGAAGLLVTATDYVAAGNRRAETRALDAACGAGGLSYVSDIFLRRVPRSPLVCP